MMQLINQYLLPVEQFIKNKRTMLGFGIIGIAFLILPIIFVPTSVKGTGEQAINLLYLILFLPIFSRVLGLSVATALMPLRKELGILMGTLVFVHSGAFILPYPEFVMSIEFWWNNGFISYLSFGVLGLLLTIPLFLTSNNWAIRKLGKAWKKLHKLVYGLIIFAVLHVVFLKYTLYSEIEYGHITFLSLYFIGKILEWKGIKLGNTKKIYPKGQKWICQPCGFIYDPTIGDPESGIKPGTEFIDIPDAWSCPDCGVTKSDFVPYDDQGIEAEVVGATFLNPHTFELSIQLPKVQPFTPGQYMKLMWSDNEGEMTRQYSIAEKKGNLYTFTIKIGEGSRSGNIIRQLQKGDMVKVGGIYGTFTLKDTENPKIFIATGTGLAPIYQMILSLPEGIQKSLYFSVATEQELFYGEKLKAIKSLDLHIHITREDIEGYEKGRVDISSLEASPETEWYLCGNPKMVADAREKLQERGFEKVYFEEFN